MREDEMTAEMIADGKAVFSDAANILKTVDSRAAYDAEVKKLFAEKEFLAVLLAAVVEECEGLSREEIIACIEGEVQVASAPLMPYIRGNATESAEPGEGVITFDLRFHMLLPIPDREETTVFEPGNRRENKTTEIKLLINLEAQRRYYVGYDLLPRSVFYVSRMISGQKGTEFIGEDYDSLKKVYSIWICMNVPKSEENSIIRYALRPEILDGTPNPNRHRFDLVNIIMVGLPKNIPEPGEHDLHRFLMTLLSGKLKFNEKKEILVEEYRIPMTEIIESEVLFMCNFSDEIWESGVSEGIAIGKIEGKAEGKAEGQSLLNRLIEALTAQNRLDDLIRSARDAEFQRKLLEEFGLV